MGRAARLGLLLLVATMTEAGPLQETPCAALTDPLTFSQLEAGIRACGWTALEDLIANLPASYRNRYVLMHSSRSLQAGTPDYPRVISFGNDARFLLAFNGDQKQASSDS